VSKLILINLHYLSVGIYPFEKMFCEIFFQ